MLLLLYHWERAPGTHRTGGWVGPRDGLHYLEKRGVSYSSGKSDDSSVVQPVT
jgi:hypothetical protein